MSEIDQALGQYLPELKPAGRYVVAFSGGRDSSVMLHAMAQHHRRASVAVHIHHGMQSVARHWPGQCQRACDALGVPLKIKDISEDVAAQSRIHGPEAGARAARYASLLAELTDDDVLLTAHHRLDQAETLLLQAFRGSGPAGLAGMPMLKTLERGRHCRPFLCLSRDVISRYAREAGLSWIGDPSNEDTRFDRSRLRGLWSGLLQGWPGLEATLARTARNMSEAAELLSERAEEDLRSLLSPGEDALDVAALLTLSIPRRANVLRHWIAERALDLPSRDQLSELIRQLEMIDAASSLRQAWGRCELRSYSGRLYAMELLPEPSECELIWPDSEAVEASDLVAHEVSGQGLAQTRGPYSLRYRSGGERLRLAGRKHSSSLKQLLQDAGIPPWVRSRIPLLFAGERLVAVADYWSDPAFEAAPGQPGWLPEWQLRPVGAPSIQIVRKRAFG